MQRRQFLQCLSGLTLLSQMPACSRITNTPNPLKFVSAGKLVANTTEQQQDQFIVVGLDANGDSIWQTNIPERAHASNISPNGEWIVVTGRRPSKQAWLLNSRTGNILHTIHAQPNRHFFGHTVFDATGTYLYSTENDVTNFAGKISKRAVKNPNNVISEFESYGVGCHELHFLPDNKTLVVANGGIRTAENSRKKLNLDSMQPNLAYIDAQTGQCLQKVSPPHHQLSIRHIDVAQTGTVAIGMQYQGEKSANIPLLFTHKLGQPGLQAMSIDKDDWHIFNQYIGSVTIQPDGRQFMATSPRGNCAVLVNIEKNKIEKKLALRDCCGLALNPDINNQSNNSKFMVSDGIGQISPITIEKSNAHVDSKKVRIHSSIKFDNHMTNI